MSVNDIAWIVHTSKRYKRNGTARRRLRARSTNIASTDSKETTAVPAQLRKNKDTIGKIAKIICRNKLARLSGLLLLSSVAISKMNKHMKLDIAPLVD